MRLNEYQRRAASTAIYGKDDFASFLKSCVLASIEGGDTTLRMPTDEFEKLVKQLEILNTYYTTMGLAGEAGEVANQVKKVFRDDDHVMYRDRREAVKKELGGVLWYIAALACECDIPLDDIAEANLDQLQQRAKKGTLHGDGDNR